MNSKTLFTGIVIAVSVYWLTSFIFGKKLLLREIASTGKGLFDSEMNHKKLAIIYCNCGEPIPSSLTFGTNHQYKYEKIKPLNSVLEKEFTDMAKDKWSFSSATYVKTIECKDEILRNDEYVTFSFCFDINLFTVANVTNQTGVLSDTLGGYTNIDDATYVWFLYKWHRTN